MRGVTVDNVDDYLESVPSDAARSALEGLRSVIRAEIPDAEEVISYGMPMYKHHGMVVGFAAFKKHCSLFPGHTVADFSKQLEGYKLSKGTIQFDPASPLPEPLVRAIVRARYDENEQIAREKGKKKK
ncbi:MAG: DUF1801 domain-containing protein [Armatimonadetes bacterium]|nr:hypothetical protein [Armatimonadota bacterium]MBS1702089.1 DUF1801 domain-containing protein [Armatimonadota bacterium]MBS1728072.1 DUF1801 domain-containing protein [Armatimonadota bacterium]